ncbi:heptahelical transmembrane protein 4-like isoform X1 [Chenopodium quinoa]|uniref:heptahelical transmembrane protein 4-like isoform X1 n=1 Tax=Chenopodium quinoa TaxID=63459 RepID=UPI000B7928DF|nr:heptahelical transmembrane protein 4-like isoform X1 [Chenopodium quinoa]
MVSSSQILNNQVDCENEEKISSTGNKKRKKLWKKIKYELIDYHNLPAYLRDNEYILGHYRCEWPLKELLLSIFAIHNETLNVWTHLIGFFLFLSLTIYTATTVSDVSDYYSLQHFAQMLNKAGLHDVHSTLVNCLTSLSKMPDFGKLSGELMASLPYINSLSSVSGWHIMEHLSNCLPERFSHLNETNDHSLRSVKDTLINTIAPLPFHPITRWPFYAFLGGAMFCLLASSACHLLCCHSKRLSYIMLRFDYAGIATLITTSFYPPVYYSFMCKPFFCNLYLSFITILGIATIVFSLSPVFQNPEYRSIRASLFFGMGVSGVGPILHKLILYWHQPEALQTTGLEIMMGALYGFGALIYAKRIPERWRPGKFDIAGHSHQLFHILVVAGAYTHYHTGLMYLKWRDLHGC